MEKHTVTNICRLGVALIVVTLTVSAARANSLLNPGFEIVGSNATTAADWFQFGNAFLNSTSNSTITVRSGLFSMQAGPTASTNLIGSGAEQDVAASAGQTWRLTGYILTWINNKVTGPDAYGVAQLVFVDNGSNVLQTVESPHFGQTANMPVNVWQPFEVDATAPAGTVTVRVYVMYIGDMNDNGNYFFDDLNLYQPSASSTGSVISQPAVQVSWPTSTSSNGVDYQIQYTPNLVFTNPPVASVLTNGGFETNAAPWFVFNGAGWSGSSPAHSGTGVMKLVQNHTTSVAGCFQTFSGITTGTVWTLTGFGYNWSAQPMFQPSTRALLKIVWLNAAGATVAPVLSGDTNLIGTIDYPSNAGVVSQQQLSSATPQNTWTFMEARATAPTNATQVQVFCLLVPTTTSTTETCLFDDLSLSQGATQLNGWNNFGPLWLGTGLTNTEFDVTGTNATKFYRVTTP